MRIFISEFLCSGALAGEELPSSLCREGRAMRDTLLGDFAAIDGVTVMTTCDSRVSIAMDSVETYLATTAEAERQLFDRLCIEADAVYVIAPELDGHLLERCRRAQSLNPQPLNCLPDTIALCSDKQRLAEHLLSRQIATISTQSAADVIQQPSNDVVAGLSFPIVLKRRDGAGSQDVFLCRSSEELQRRWQSLESQSPVIEPTDRMPDHMTGRMTGRMVVQPFVAGQPLSVAAIVTEEGEPTILPLAEQHFSEDGTFCYLGGAVPARTKSDRGQLQENVSSLVRDICRAVPGLRGYVGFDLILPDVEPSRPILVEINPRLTTSYVGYRRLTTDNLAGWIQNPARAETINWFDARVEFTAEGVVKTVASASSVTP